MDLCLMIEGQEGVSWEQWRALARACEEHSIPALFRSDHYMNLDGNHPEREAMDAWATLSALCAVTSNVRLGTLVSPATFRHPSNLAKLVATADEISGGRVELGLGAGWHEGEHTAYGFDFPTTRIRMDRLAEQLEVVLGTWTRTPFSFDGEHYRLVGLNAQPKPVQRPHPPLIMGGYAGPRSAALAARFADEYNSAFPTVDEVKERRARIAEACERSGRDPIPFSVMTGFVVGSDRAGYKDRARSVTERTGADASAFVADPPAAWITGTVDEAVEQLQALKDAGVSRVMCQNLLHDDLDVVALIGSELAPQLA
ncbi:MAG TPA: TIGR03560 family F420-dependent LLM class oxidoreductase [Solirubrobacteraceae bacterium]|nr:TIGR03560 family F420-dependent LLM class oxidoreductase [Solirubrobacteraceae bacterium]